MWTYSQEVAKPLVELVYIFDHFMFIRFGQRFNVCFADNIREEYVLYVTKTVTNELLSNQIYVLLSSLEFSGLTNSRH